MYDEDFFAELRKLPSLEQIERIRVLMNAPATAQALADSPAFDPWLVEHKRLIVAMRFAMDRRPN